MGRSDHNTASRKDLEFYISEANNSFKSLLFGIDYSDSEFTEHDAKTFGWQVVLGDKLLGFDDTRDYNLIRTRLADLRRHGYPDVILRWNMGSFALDGELAEALLDTFRTELDQREGSFNSDEIWQSWLARDRDDYVQQFSKGDEKKGSAGGMDL